MSGKFLKQFWLSGWRFESTLSFPSSSFRAVKRVLEKRSVCWNCAADLSQMRIKGFRICKSLYRSLWSVPREVETASFDIHVVDKTDWYMHAKTAFCISSINISINTYINASWPLIVFKLEAFLHAAKHITRERFFSRLFTSRFASLPSLRVTRCCDFSWS